MAHEGGLTEAPYNVAVVDASMIESVGAPKRKALEVDETGAVSPSPASKDQDAKWVKKAGRFYLGYKLHASRDAEGYLEGIHITGVQPTLEALA